MNLWEGITLAFQQLRAQKLKSFFSTLGVILGVMFLIVVVTVVEGLDRYVREEVTSQVFGVNTITLRRWTESNINTSREEWRERQRRPRLTFEDGDLIREKLSIPALVSVQSQGGTSLVGDNGRAVRGVQVIGGDPEIFDVRNLVVERGRPFTPQEAEAGAPVIVIGTETADLVFEESEPIGRTLRIRGFPYRIIGVLEERGSLFGQSQDNLVVAPVRSPVQAFTAPRGFVEEIIVQTIDPDLLRDAQMEIEGIMRVDRQLRPSEESNFAVETADEAISFWDNISTILFTALPMLVSIALVVGGIVIMNIMLVSVMERTREIGVRKALGAKRRDILTQVLIESATLSTVGAIFGIVVGIAIAKFVAAVSPMPAAVSPFWVGLGVTIGMATGIIAGVYPATQASKMNPVDALRYE